jgi:hypothetical protein
MTTRLTTALGRNEARINVADTVTRVGALPFVVSVSFY